MQLDGISLIRLTPEHSIKPFDCDNEDLNDFFINNCVHYQNELLAVTYILENHEKTVAFFSILNDKIALKDVGNPNLWDKLFREKMPENKRFNSYPAMKIGRLGVNVEFKGQKIGTAIIDYLKAWFITNNRTGCKYITVDAYSESLNFYKKNKFNFLTEKDVNKDTRAMYFDLQQIANLNTQVATEPLIDSSSLPAPSSN